MKNTVSSTIDYERDLNPAQLEAVTAADGPVLIIAGAAGKRPGPSFTAWHGS